MHVGYSALFQNVSGQETDSMAIGRELALADLAEPLGFDSVWAPEHHFTNYELMPSPTHFLTWIAARTSRVQLGSMVTVLPWHDPVRVAEQWSMLDELSRGRAILGIGRGLGRVEFDGFRLVMGESRDRFSEYAEAIVQGLESGFIEYDGQHLRQPRTAIRPFPGRSFRGRTYASAVSPRSIELMARLGVGLMVIAQKPWATTIAEIGSYNERYAELNGEQPPAPIVVVFIAVHEDAVRAEEMYERYLVGYSRSALEHYQFDDVRIADVPGYEYYEGISRNIAKHGRDQFVRFLADLQVWGTPDVVTDQLIEYQRMLGAAGVVGVFSYGGMPLEQARGNLELFASSVLPRLHAHKVDRGVGTSGPASAMSTHVSPTSVVW